MAIVSRFEADFSSFHTAVEAATGKLKSLNDGSVNVAAGLTKMGNAFSGQRIIQDANLMTKAINDGGGAATLTAKEMSRVNDQVTEAIAKYKALGGQAPKSMLDLADATKQTSSSTQSFLGGLKTVNGLLGGLGIGLSVGAVVGFGKALLADADALVKLSDKTSVSLQWLQKFQVVGDDTGNTVEELAAAVSMMQKRFDDDAFKAALTQLGIRFEDIRNLAPEEQFVTLSDAVRQVKDPVLQAQLATDLFGRTGVTVLPAIKRGFDDVKDAAIGMSDATVRSLDKTGDELQKVWRQIKTEGASALVTLLRGVENSQFAMLTAEEQAKFLGRQLKEMGASASVAGPKLAKVAPLDLDQHFKRIAAQVGEAHEQIDRLPKPTDTAKAAFEGAAEKVKKFEEELRKNTEAAKKNEPALAGLHATVGILNTKELELVQASIKVYDEFTKLEGKVRDIEKQDWVKAFGVQGLAEGLEHLGTKTGDVEKVRAHLEKVDKEAKTTGESIRTNLAGALEAIPGILQNAFTGGGGIVGALKAIAVQVGEAIVKPMIAAMVTAVQDAAGLTTGLNDVGAAGRTAGAGMTAGTIATAGFTAGVSAFIYLAQKSSSEAKRFQILLDGWTATVLKFASAEQVATAKGDDWLLMQNVLTKAYQDTGRSMDQLIEDMRGLVAARTEGPEAMETAILKLNEAFVELEAHNEAVAAQIEIVNGAVATLGGVIDEVGIGIPDFLQPMLDAMMAAPGLTDDLKASITGLRESASPDFAKLEALAKSYGGEISKLGPTFQQAHVTADAGKWISDIEKLVAAGGDYNGILGFMADEASHVVQESIKFGTTIPENMRPYIQSLIDSGQLLGENKEQITDISALKFGASVKTDVDKLKDAIQLLADAIAKIPEALGKLPKRVEVGVYGVYHPPDIPSAASGYDEYAASGGLVTATGIQHFAGGGTVLPFRSRGTDTVPAMLTPGEVVLNKTQQVRLLNATAGNGSADLRPLLLKISDQLQKADAAAKARDALLRDHPRATALALRAALATAPRRAS